MKNVTKLFFSIGLFLTLSTSGMAQSWVQWIHNSPDDFFAVIDIYVNGELAWDDAAFRTATEFTIMASGDLDVAVAPGSSNSADDAVWTGTVSVPDADTVVVIASGLLDPSAHAPNPDGIDTSFGFLVNADAQVATLPGFFYPTIVHGVPDAPALTGVAVLTGTYLSLGTYGTVGPFPIFPYPGVPTALGAVGPVAINVFAEPDTASVLASAMIDVASADGVAATVIASGFLDVSANKAQAEPVAFFAVFPDGSVTQLSETPTAVEPIEGIPSGFVLGDNYPNPFNPTTTFEYEVPETMHVTVRVYDVRGHLVDTLVDGVQSASTYRATFEAVDLPSGVYFYQLQAGSQLLTKKMMLLK